MGSLSSELLSEIFSWVKSSFWGTSNLLTCLSVCKQWHEIAVPILCRHIVLSSGNVELFAARFNLTYAAYVRSLTLRLTQPPLSSYDLSSIIAANAELERRLLRLEPLLESLDKLLSFSLYVPIVIPERCRFKISARSIIGLINSLPRSCVNIEIDAGGYDRNIIASGEEAHICENLRLVLPRMNHVRIHLSLVCPTLVGILAAPYKYDLDSFIPAKLPHLRSFLINCTESRGSDGICLPAKTAEAQSYRVRIHPWPAMTSALQKFVDAPDCCPTSATVRIHTSTMEDMTDIGIYDTMVVSDISSHSTHAFPILKVSSTAQLGWLTRFEDSEGILTTTRGLVAIAEGQLWKTLIGGARLPSTIAKSEAQGIMELPMSEESDWRAKNPEISCTLWKNEALVGRKLLHAEIRNEGVTYVNPVAVMEETPQGWYRPVQSKRRVLMRDERG
ncbi:hypothetical protein F4781DRAFT_415532 [Annulohypoxylon bovei var. microspora]|nr:hypothetical protein F4781DRAFT_415532 [Annulohypoxylon bovei var. microspora]